MVKIVGQRYGITKQCIVLLLLLSAQWVVAEARHAVHIPAQNAVRAFDQLAEQTNSEFIFPYDIAKARKTQKVKGFYTVMEALTIMLQDSGLSCGLSDKGAIRIFLSDSAHNNVEGDRSMKKYRKNLLASTIAFFVGGGVQVGLTQEAKEQSGSDSSFVLEEIVITATKRETNLNETAASIVAISEHDINAKNLVGMDDFLRFTPGVNFVDRGVGQNAIVIRGVAADLESGRDLTGPTVGTYFGEAPISGFGINGGGTDLKLIDIERIEVLRGPQGTLFGAGSLSGTVRIVPNSPNLSDIEGGIKTEYSQTSGEGGENNKVEGVINFPVIEDVLAVKAIAYRHDDSGYVKNIAGSYPGFSDVPEFFGAGDLAQDEGRVGDSITEGIRLSTLFQPVDDIKITLSYVDQEMEQDGLPYVNIDTGDGYDQLALQAGDVFDNRNGLARPNKESEDSEWVNEGVEFTNLVVDYDLGWGTIISSSLWLSQDSSIVNEFSSFAGGAPFPGIFTFDNDVFVQELRLVSQLDSDFQFIVGGYYEDVERSDGNILHFSGDPSVNGNPFGGTLSGDLSDSLLNEQHIDRELTQKALFGEVTYAFSDQLDLTVGMRLFDYERERKTIARGVLTGDPVDSSEKTDEDGDTYKVNLSYTPDEDSLIYGQWSEGFRLGNAQDFLPLSLCDVDDNGVLDGTVAPITESFDSDTLENYELGTKLTLLDNHMQLNASIFRINWEGIPLNLISPTCFFSQAVSAGDAVSEGGEVEVVYSLNDRVQLNFGGSYTKAELKSDSIDLNASKGDPLPGSPDYTITMGFLYDFDFVGHESYFRADYTYVGGFYNNLQEEGEESGDYGQLNIKAGMSVNKIIIGVFGSNLTDQDELTWVSSGSPDNRGFRLRPRTIGLELGYKF